MPRPTFSQALDAILIHEGGFSNHPRDPGGATMKGVTQRVYDGYRTRKGASKRSVAKIGTDELMGIYRTLYADAVRFEELPPGVAYVVFDGAVNSGPSQSVKWLQRALGCKRIDGTIGPETLGKIETWPGKDYDKLVTAICERRMWFLKALKTWDAFGKGWTRRVDGVRKLGQAWAQGSVGPLPVWVEGGAAKAIVEDAKAPPSTAPGDASAGAGVATGGLGGALKQLQDQIEPYTGSADWIGTVVVALAVAGFIIAAGGIAYRVYAARKKRLLNDVLDITTPVAGSAPA